MAADELAVLHYTSGSTGRLKAAMQTVGNRMASLPKVVMGRMHAGPDDVLLLTYAPAEAFTRDMHDEIVATEGAMKRVGLEPQ